MLSKKYLKMEDISIQTIILWELLFTFDIYGTNCIVSENLENLVKIFGEKMGKNEKIKLYSKDKEIEKLKSNSCDLIILLNDTIVDENNNVNNMINMIIRILSNQSENGTTILQIGDTFTFNTLKLIYILTSFFDDVIVYKPYTSKSYEIDKYLILSKFKSNKNIDMVVKQLEKSISPKDKFHINLFPDLTLSNDFISIFKYINIKLVNTQQIYINDIIVFIKGNDYFGDDYHKYKSIQLAFTKWWIMTFFPPSVNLYKKNKEELDSLISSTQEKIKLETQNFLQTIM